MSDNTQSINISVTVDEANYLLMALSQRPFGEVVNLIQKVKAQAEEQINKVQQNISN